jgi:hypothetical protein
VKNLGENLLIEAKMPLRELIRDFDDRLKSASQGYASFTYELADEREAEVEKLEILVVEDIVPALTRIVPKKDVEREGRQTVERLKDLLPKDAIFPGHPGKGARQNHCSGNDSGAKKEAWRFRQKWRRPHSQDEAMEETGAGQRALARDGARGYLA